MESTRSVCPVCRASSPIDDVPCSDCGHGQWFRFQDIDNAVILTVMPGMRGPELAERVRELSPNTRVIFMSGYSGDALADCRF